jgi:hypothetical protein
MGNYYKAKKEVTMTHPEKPAHKKILAFNGYDFF